jgi:hypothetical protein
MQQTIVASSLYSALVHPFERSCRSDCGSQLPPGLQTPPKFAQLVPEVIPLPLRITKYARSTNTIKQMAAIIITLTDSSTPRFFISFTSEVRHWQPR